MGSGSGELGLNTGFDLGKWEVLSGKWGDMLGMNLGEREEGSEKLYLSWRFIFGSRKWEVRIGD